MKTILLNNIKALTNRRNWDLDTTHSIIHHIDLQDSFLTTAHYSPHTNKMVSSRPEEYKDVRTADLTTIQFADLFDKSEVELQKLVKSCEKDGFFYLDLKSAGSEKFWKDLFEIDTITKKWFAQPAEVKLKTPTVSLAHG